MRFSSELIKATLLRRYKRFLADIVLPDGTETTIHCPNPGAMDGLAEPGATVFVSRSANPKRKLPLSWELTETAHGLVGINTANPNRIVKEALHGGQIAPLAQYGEIRPEVKYGERSRVDFLLKETGEAECYVEVKNVHLFRTPEFAEFPDCVTARGAKHLKELAAMATAGHRAVMLFLVQRDTASHFQIAVDIDPTYGRGLLDATDAGVEVLVYTCCLSLDGIALGHQVPYIAQDVPDAPKAKTQGKHAKAQ